MNFPSSEEQIAQPPIQNYISPQGFPKDPRKESMLDMIRYCVFPYFRLKSFTFCIGIINIVFFIFLVQHDHQELEEGLLAPSQQTLFAFGEVYPYYMKINKEIYRYILPLFMHSNLLHLLSSVFLFTYIYSFIEHTIGVAKTAFLYFMTGIGGITFNIILTNEPGVAGSVPLGAFLFSLTLEGYIFQSKLLQLSLFQNARQPILIPFFKSCALLLYFFWMYLNFQNTLFYGMIGAYIICLLLWEFLKPTSLIKKYELSLLQQQQQQQQQQRSGKYFQFIFLAVSLLFIALMLIYFYNYKEVLIFQAS